jgi:hypothetical protein
MRFSRAVLTNATESGAVGRPSVSSVRIDTGTAVVTLIAVTSGHGRRNGIREDNRVGILSLRRLGAFSHGGQTFSLVVSTWGADRA